MRSLVVVFLLAACGTDAASPDWSSTRTFSFGPFALQPIQEINDQCVQITLGNSEDLYIDAVELTTGPGFHHSNWFFVPADDPTTGAIGAFSGPDGTFACADRHFDQAVAALKGGVLFAQSTQSPHEIQQFPTGVALKIPAKSKIVSEIHLLNPGDSPLTLSPTIALTPIPKTAVATLLAGMSFEDHALGLPPNAQSSFSVDCDFAPTWQNLYNLGQVASPQPDFKIYYSLAHYHALGTGMTIEALKPDGTAATIYSTANRVGDTLGRMLDPAFDMTGYTHVRFTCDYYNNTASTVAWGIGNQEMCVFLAFSDSTYFWAGGAINDDPPGPGTDVNGVMTYNHVCSVNAVDASR